MLLSRVAHYLPTSSTLYLFSRSTLGKSSKRKYETKSSDFQQLQSEYAKDYFENYRAEVEKDTVIRDFRRQVFDKNTQSDGMIDRMDKDLDNQQNQIDRLLNQGSRENISKYSKKVMQHITNNRSMFKGKENKDVFKDYANYSAYTNNYVSIEDRNYLDGDMLDRPNTEARTYEFIDSLPDNYQEKSEVRRQIEILEPTEASNLSISEYGKRLQKKHNQVQHFDKMKQQYLEQNSFKMTKKKGETKQTVFESMNQTLDVDRQETFQQTILSTEAMNKIYDLYLQGWSVREISRRFGILPARAKFHIWARARLYNEVLPKYGLKFLLNTMRVQTEAMDDNHVMDYGMDLNQLTKTDRYEEIVGWESKRVDVQRTPDQYTEALEKLEKVQKISAYDMVQVGTHGKQNKKYMLKDWKIYRGKKSDDYFLKNKIFRKLMEEKRKTKAIYY